MWWPFSSHYPEQSLQFLRPQYDYIVVGGGNAGCVLARRLSEGGKHTVLVVERGDARDSFLDSTPLLGIHPLGGLKHTSVVESAPIATLGDRSVSLACGSGLGGTTRINGGQYTCGVPAEFNSWNERGRKGWSYEDLKPYFRKSETWNGPVPEEYHGLDGRWPLNVRSFQGYFYGSSERAMAAAKSIGFLDILDMHSPLEPSIGVNKMQFTIDPSGRRQSAFRAYLHGDFVKEHDNLHVCTKTSARKLEFSTADDGSIRAEGVELHSLDGRQRRVVTARREIILSCGALHTPQLLLLSGIGPQDHLHEMGIRVVKDMPGVGAHFQDHVLVPTVYNCPLSDSLWAMVRQPTTLIREIYRYIRYGTGWFLCTFAEMEIFGLSSLVASDGRVPQLTNSQLDSFNPKNISDFAVFCSPLADSGRLRYETKGLLGLMACLMQSKSVGRVRLRSSDPTDEPIFDMQYLTRSEDYTALRAALRVTVAIAREMRAEGYELDDSIVPDVSSDAALDEYIHKHASTMFHYSSSCRMAPEDDSEPGVVDDELRVHGIPNLRIVDASIFPDVPATHPSALIYAISEKCADLVRQCASASG
ncbi:uncharacterized protein FIBRA_06651 [Fibroporia radiculosa]|uniref:Glucose-methanol-choline oxidoreductase N-terminal domain-containing protein n=1 Tax=Fibroporia radiculosa TaxID=599839 RepID=J4IBD5_9APHY|nr:uncharacterized protein FIBRA_06651 [Fibroporia radiculosa]CCM04471.1 predicted protein [Fibroporia radiculosa]